MKLVLSPLYEQTTHIAVYESHLPVIYAFVSNNCTALLSSLSAHRKVDADVVRVS